MARIHDRNGREVTRPSKTFPVRTLTCLPLLPQLSVLQKELEEAKQRFDEWILCARTNRPLTPQNRTIFYWSCSSILTIHLVIDPSHISQHPLISRPSPSPITTTITTTTMHRHPRLHAKNHHDHRLRHHILVSQASPLSSH